MDAYEYAEELCTHQHQLIDGVYTYYGVCEHAAWSCFTRAVAWLEFGSENSHWSL